MRFGLVLVLVLVGALAFAVITEPSRPVRPPCESGMWQEQWNGDGHNGEEVCLTMDRPHHDPIPSFSYSLDV
jgi:hypothetical protein